MKVQRSLGIAVTTPLNRYNCRSQRWWGLQNCTARRSFLRVPKVPVKYYTAEEAIERVQKLRKEADEDPNRIVDESSYVVSLNLNLTPNEKKHHKLHGYFEFPHKVLKMNNVCKVIALTMDEDLRIEALQKGATRADDLSKPYEIQRMLRDIKAGRIQRVLATREMEARCKKPRSRFAFKLKKYQLTPTVQDRTLLDPEEFIEQLVKHVSGTYQEFTIASGATLSTSLGRIRTHTKEMVLDNLNHVLEVVYAAQPADFGVVTKKTHHKKRQRLKATNEGKYVISATLGAHPLCYLPLDLADVLQYVDDTGLYTV